MTNRYASKAALGAAALSAILLGQAPSADASWNTGGAVLTGTITAALSDPTCKSVKNDVSAVAVGSVVDVRGSVHNGDVKLHGTGCGPALTMTAFGQGLTGGFLACPLLRGSFVGGSGFVVRGECSSNGVVSDSVTFTANTVMGTPTGRFVGTLAVDNS